MATLHVQYLKLEQLFSINCQVEHCTVYIYKHLYFFSKFPRRENIFQSPCRMTATVQRIALYLGNTPCNHSHLVMKFSVKFCVVLAELCSHRS